MASSLNRGFVLALLLVAALLGNASAATFVVGDTLGWRVPNTPADYSNWATQHTYAVGDVLVFNFMTGAHDVAQVTKASFDGCSSNSPLLLQTVGPSNITLTSAGETFYICTFGSHCSLGQKLAINVSASSTPAPAPAPTTAPMPPPTTPTPTMPPTPAPSMPAPTPAPSPEMPAPTPTPAPAPMPGGGAPSTPPGPAPGSSADVTPPPPPSSATISTGSASLVGFAFVAIGLMI